MADYAGKTVYLALFLFRIVNMAMVRVPVCVDVLTFMSVEIVVIAVVV